MADPNPYAPPGADLGAGTPGSPVFFGVGEAKLAIMSVCTLSLYQVYWFYRNFCCMREQGRTLWPVPRALFYSLVSYSLFRAVDVHRPGLAAAPLALAVLAFAGTFSLPDPWWLVGHLSFLPLLPVRRAIEEINAQRSPEADPNTRIRGWNWLAVGLGGVVVLLTVAGAFMPADYFE